MEVKVEAEQVAKFRSLRNSVGFENSQSYKISAVIQFPSICGSNFLPTSNTHLRVLLGFFVFGVGSMTLAYLACITTKIATKCDK